MAHQDERLRGGTRTEPPHDSRVAPPRPSGAAWLHGSAAAPRHDPRADPVSGASRSARASGVGPASGREALRPAPRDRRPRTTAAWVWLVVGLGALMTGIAVGHGLLIAAGLVAAGVGGQLFDPDHRRRHRPGHRTAA